MKIKNPIIIIFLGVIGYTAINWILGPDIREYVENIVGGNLSVKLIVAIGIISLLLWLGVRNEYINR